MAAPTNAAKREESPCQPGAVHTWHETDMPKYLGDVRCWVNSGKHLLALSFSGLDPERTSSLIGFRDPTLTQAGATEAFQIVLPVRVVLDRYLVRDPGKRDIRLRAAKLL